MLLNAQSNNREIVTMADVPSFASHARYYDVMEDGSMSAFRDTPMDEDVQSVTVRIKRRRDQITCNAFMKIGPMFQFDGQINDGRAVTLIIHPESIRDAVVIPTMDDIDELVNRFYLPNSALINLNDGDEVFVEFGMQTLALRGYFQRGYDDDLPRKLTGSLTPLHAMGDLIYRACTHVVDVSSFTKDVRVLEALEDEGGYATIDALAAPCVTLAALLSTRHSGFGLDAGTDKTDDIKYISPLGEHGPKSLMAYSKVLSSLRPTDAFTSVSFQDVTFVLSYYVVLHFLIHGVPPDFIAKVYTDPNAITYAILKKSLDYYPGKVDGSIQLANFKTLLNATRQGNAAVTLRPIESTNTR
jgi:hypothetical protein